VVLVEYGDYQCPHCGHAHPIVKRLQKQLAGKLCFVFRNFPLTEVHAEAERAAELRLPAAALKGALAEHEYLQRIRDDFRGGVRSGVNGTPTFFINGDRHDDAFEFENLLAAIEARL